jgi:very-short-patch-repair endonuclease
MELTPIQNDIITAPSDARIFLSGPAGSGKTTVGVERMIYLLEQGVPAESILVLTPQRTLQEPYKEIIQSPTIGAGGEVTLATVGGLARRMVDLFWTLAAEPAGFAHPDQPPIFLTLETAQYYMAHIVRPLLDEGYFESLTINRNRLYSQIIDNLNKAAVVGFPHSQIGERLDKAWLGDPSQRRIYADAQDCANRFRQYCLDHNLLDFSLQLEIFREHLWGDPIVHDYLARTYRHLIYDNLEEDGPRAHDIIREWLPELDSTLLIYDENAGYRRFLGADPETGYRLSELCDAKTFLAESFVTSAGLQQLSFDLARVIDPLTAPSLTLPRGGRESQVFPPSGERLRKGDEQTPHHSTKPPLSAALKARARELRKNATDPEVFLWQFLRRNQINDARFRRQHPYKGYILDFYCHELKVAIELDGSQHLDEEQHQHDEQRTQDLNEDGIQVLRFWNSDVLNNTEAVLGEIWEVIEEIRSSSPSLSFGHLSPEGGEKKSPPPSGEGWEGAGEGLRKGESADTLQYADAHYYPELLDWLTEEIATILDEGLPPSEIVVLAPYLSDALRFSLMHRLEAQNIPVRSHRPSRSLRDEPATQSLLTLAALAHPQWGIRPSEFDVAYAFMQAIDGMDLIRANLLTKIVYRASGQDLSPFDGIKPEVQERITYVFGAHYTELRNWLLAYREQAEVPPFDHFLRKLFGEILSQPGFGFHRDLDAARVAASLIESVKKFRWAMASSEADALTLGREYIEMLNEGVIAAQYLGAWDMQSDDAVLVAPAYTFLMQNRAVAVQFWLNPGSDGWVERLFQPLTHPYVLSRSWDNAEGHYWTDADDVAANQAALARLTTGLLRRCKNRLYLGLSELGESGFEQRGVLLKAFQRVLQEQRE